MTYYYLITVEFTKGNTIFLKQYKKSYLEVGELFVFLETRHKGNYALVSIKPLKYI